MAVVDRAISIAIIAELILEGNKILACNLIDENLPGYTAKLFQRKAIGVCRYQPVPRFRILNEGLCAIQKRCSFFWDIDRDAGHISSLFRSDDLLCSFPGGIGLNSIISGIVENGLSPVIGSEMVFVGLELPGHSLDICPSRAEPAIL